MTDMTHRPRLPFDASQPVIPVVTLRRVADAVPLAHALLAGGIRSVEITLRTPVALECMRAIVRDAPEMQVGAGTVCSADDAQAAAAAGCAFAVSPGYSGDVERACRDAGLPWLPGVATASEVMRARAAGYRLLKFFPAAAAGGVALLKAWAEPFADVRFCPTGGIRADTAAAYLALPNVPFCGGSWLTPLDAIDAQDWSRITALARAAQALRPTH